LGGAGCDCVLDGEFALFGMIEIAGVAVSGLGGTA